MCYSAQVTTNYRQYVKLTGATIDIDQFVEIFGLRDADPSIKIPRAVERWFDEPSTPKERHLRELIEQHRAREGAKLERELFALRERLAVAERKLAVKPTKTAAESQRIATDKAAKVRARLEQLRDSKPRASDGRIFPLRYAPIVLKAGGENVVRLARYHLRKPTEPAFIDRKLPGLYNARRDSLGRYWKAQFGTTHAVMLAESFYENVERDGKNAVAHFVPRPADTMLVACLYAEWRDKAGGNPLLSFAAVTDEPPPEVAAAGHDRMIVSLKPEHLDAWLTPQGRVLTDLENILSDRQAPYYEHELLAA